ncbi:MAG: Na+/H+ antiporter NhaA, partial [Myxococcales bacterium]
MNKPDPERSPAPEAWLPAQRLVRELLRPVERFLRIEAASGILLLLASLAALGWANSPWAASYAHLWHTPVALQIGGWRASADVHFLVNDVLMVLFFFSVGLEIRREMHEGELADVRRAALPIVAAVGGMAAPALLFWLCNRGLPSQGGWGIPTATDIAFAVGVLALLGKRVPPALRILLLALAIIDDIGAILIIAVFYSSGLSPGGLAVAAVGVAGVLLWQRIGVRNAWAYVVPGFVVWLGCLRGGIHPTLAGVVLGLLTPVRPWLGERGFLQVADQATRAFRDQTERDDHRAEDLLGPLAQVGMARQEAVSAVVRHPDLGERAEDLLGPVVVALGLVAKRARGLVGH